MENQINLAIYIRIMIDNPTKYLVEEIRRVCNSVINAEFLITDEDVVEIQRENK